MKRALLYKAIVLNLCIAVLMSCEKVKTQVAAENNSNTNIIGEWILEDYNYTGVSTSTILGQEIKTNYIGTGVDMDFMINFKENKEVHSSGNFNIKLTYTINGQTGTTTESAGDLIKQGFSGTWEVKGDSLYIVNFTGEKSASYIETLTENTLKTKIIDKRTRNIQGVQTEIYNNITMELTKK
ncbi:MAG: lipocalin family protein [Flavobacteriaceae bacterium]|nr:lipocalin family protein [Flavobacteriaceae bacterium]